MIFAVPLREPFETGIVAEAVVPTPTPTDFGAEIETVIAVPTYPDPPLVIVKALIVPPAETVAVIAAATGSEAPPLTIRASTVSITIEDSFSS